MDYLVTGGAGFIGSNIVAALLERGHSVRVIDDFSTGKRHNIEHLTGKIDLVEGSIVNLDDCRKAVQGIDKVLHQAAIPSVPRSVANPIATNAATAGGTLNMLVAARDADVKRFVMASSSSIYGDQEESMAKVETMCSQPISPYGIDKMAAERYCQVFYQLYGLETVALRYFNVYGPRQDPQSTYAAVIPKFITAYLDGVSPTIFGDGEQTRDFTYVGNVIEANLLAATQPAEKVAGEVFNTALGNQVSLNELVRILQQKINEEVEPIYTDPRDGDIKHSMADISKAKEKLGYTLRYDFAAGLALTIEWYRQNR